MPFPRRLAENRALAELSRTLDGGVRSLERLDSENHARLDEHRLADIVAANIGSDLEAALRVCLFKFCKPALRKDADARQIVIHVGARRNHPHARFLELGDELPKNRVRVLDRHFLKPAEDDGSELAAEKRHGAHLPRKHRAIVALLGRPAYRLVAFADGKRKDVVGSAHRGTLARPLHGHHIDSGNASALCALDEKPRIFPACSYDDDLVHDGHLLSSAAFMRSSTSCA